MPLKRRRERFGHIPGSQDVSTEEPGMPFLAKPNFYYFEACGRPCWQPIFGQPEIPKELGHSLTKGWPCEAYFAHDRSKGEACYNDQPKDDPGEGDWLQVIGQVKGQKIRNEIGEESDIWDVVKVPKGNLAPGAHPDLAATEDGCFIGYAADLWLGNTGWHDIPYKP